MFLIYALLAALVVTAVLYLVSAIFNYKTKFMPARTIGICICVALLLVSISLGFAVRDDLASAHERYDELMLYYNTVNYSTNEYVRYDYFDKVEVYNEWYNKLEANSTSWLLAAFFPSDWNAEFSAIDFQLHGDEYVE